MYILGSIGQGEKSIRADGETEWDIYGGKERGGGNMRLKKKRRRKKRKKKDLEAKA